MVAKVGHLMTHGEQGSLIFDLTNVFRGVFTVVFCCRLWNTISAVRDGRYALTRRLPSRETGSRVFLEGKDVLRNPRLQRPPMPTRSVGVHRKKWRMNSVRNSKKWNANDLSLADQRP